VARQVDKAVARGWSWAQIARPLRISKQAAHRRHAGRPPAAPDGDGPAGDAADAKPRVVITGTARDVVARARAEAEAAGAPQAEPAHLLVALLQAPAGTARDALLELGMDLDAAREQLGGAGDDLPRRRSRRFARTPGIAPATRRVLERSLAESERLCHGHIGPEHLLLALLRDEDGPAVALLGRLGVAGDDVEHAVCEVLKHTDFARTL